MKTNNVFIPTIEVGDPIWFTKDQYKKLSKPDYNGRIGLMDLTDRLLAEG